METPELKTKDQLFAEKQAAMPDDELIKLVHEEVSKLCKSGGRTFTMCVPPMITDSDMLICELANRFRSIKERLESQQSFEELIDRYIKEELPDAETPYHYEAEIAAGFRHFKIWLNSHPEQLKEKTKEYRSKCPNCGGHGFPIKNSHLDKCECCNETYHDR